MTKRNDTEKKPRRRTPHFGEVGAPPGVIAPPPNAEKTRIRVMAYSAGDLLEKSIDELDDIPALLKKWDVVWLDVVGLADVDRLEALGHLFSIHHLALEDVVQIPQRPKVEEYTNYLFFAMRMLRYGQRLDVEQLSMVVGKGFVITFQEHEGDCLGPVRNRIRNAGSWLRQREADFLAYAILDALVDSYYPLLEQLGDRLEDLEDRAFDRPDDRVLIDIRAMKWVLLQFRRAVWPLREAFAGMLRFDHSLIREETRLYLRDCYDHLAQILDIIETSRDMTSGLMDAYMSSLSNRTNDIMKVLTIFASIFIPLTFIAGLYGMNFNPEVSPWNMPELNWPYGYPMVLGVMVLLAAAMLHFFYRLGWLTRRKKHGRRLKNRP
jgi:magnesium transporter